MKWKFNFKYLTLMAAIGLLWSCNPDFEDEFSLDNANKFPATVQFTSVQYTLDEDSENPRNVTVRLVGPAQTEDVTVSYTVSGVNLVEGVGYNFVTSSLVIPAGEFSGSISVEAIDNEDISEGPQELVFTLTGTSSDKLSIGTENAIGRTAKLLILDNDFWCTRNTIAKWVATEYDEGYATCSASISFATEPGPGCLTFRIVGGFSSNFGGCAGGNMSYIVNIEEDEPESSTGNVLPSEIFNLNNAAGTGSYSNKGRVDGGYYDLDDQILVVYYSYFGTANPPPANPLWTGTLIYE